MNIQTGTKFKEGDYVYFPAYGTKVYKVRKTEARDELDYPLAVYELGDEGAERLIENFDEHGCLFTGGVPVLFLATLDAKQSLEASTGFTFDEPNINIKFGDYLTIPKPITKVSELEEGDVYYVIDLGCLLSVTDLYSLNKVGLFKQVTFANDDTDRHMINFRLAHRTKENATVHAEALLRYNKVLVESELVKFEIV